MTIVSEKIGKRDKESIDRTPVDGIKLSWGIYLFFSGIIIIFKQYVPMIISNDIEVINYASTIIVAMVVMNVFNPMQTIYKYALQACDDGKYVLYVTAAVNGCIFCLILFWYYVVKADLACVFISLFINYLALTIIYKIRYRNVVTNSLEL